jgi:hypothetical protein
MPLENGRQIPWLLTGPSIPPMPVFFGDPVSGQKLVLMGTPTEIINTVFESWWWRHRRLLVIGGAASILLGVVSLLGAASAARLNGALNL